MLDIGIVVESSLYDSVHMANGYIVTSCLQTQLCLYSPGDKTSYRQISWSLEAARLDVIMIVSL